MANQEHLALLKQGVVVWSQWREEHSSEKIDLSGAELSGAHLKGALLANTIFAYVDLRSVKELVEVKHAGPSIVQMHTIQLPQDGSALHFYTGLDILLVWMLF